jgi:hypothetical protein
MVARRQPQEKAQQQGVGRPEDRHLASFSGEREAKGGSAQIGEGATDRTRARAP